MHVLLSSLTAVIDIEDMVGYVYSYNYIERSAVIPEIWQSNSPRISLKQHNKLLSSSSSWKCMLRPNCTWFRKPLQKLLWCGGEITYNCIRANTHYTLYILASIIATQIGLSVEVPIVFFLLVPCFLVEMPITASDRFLCGTTYIGYYSSLLCCVPHIQL